MLGCKMKLHNYNILCSYLYAASCNGHWKILSYRVGRSSGKFSIQQLGFLHVVTLLIKVIQHSAFSIQQLGFLHVITLLIKIHPKLNSQWSWSSFTITSVFHAKSIYKKEHTKRIYKIHVYNYTCIQLYMNTIIQLYK